VSLTVLLRIRQRAQFDAVLSSPPVAKSPHFALHRASGSALAHAPHLFPVQGVWFGVMVPKRWAKRAVTRNLLRRQMYAMAQAHLPSATACAVVVRLRSGFAVSRFPSAASTALKQLVRQELSTLLAGAPRA